MGQGRQAPGLTAVGLCPGWEGGTSMTVTEFQPRGLFSVPVACPLPGLRLSESSPREPSPASSHLGKTRRPVYAGTALAAVQLSQRKVKLTCLRFVFSAEGKLCEDRSCALALLHVGGIYTCLARMVENTLSGGRAGWHLGTSRVPKGVWALCVGSHLPAGQGTGRTIPGGLIEHLHPHPCCR